MSKRNSSENTRLQLWGWVLFVLCAGLYLAANIEAKSTLGIIGSIVFLVACFVFMIPLMRSE
ncbi:MAG: cytochrome oxidase subunit III [Anaerolineaceae bacterium]|nr:cytochrome oxidase subunit III [Anaerolineaceae bacterium]